MAKVFISYARKDTKELAVKLHADLVRANHLVWLDLREIEVGGNFTEDIERAIDDCDVALILMSEASSQSQWCRMEQLRALRKGKKIIPILAQNTTEPPLHLEHLNFINFSNPAQYDDMSRDVLSDISASMAFRSKKEDAPTKDSPFKAVKKTTANTPTQKRNAPAFRRHIRTLQNEDWLGLRSWWTYFLFMFTDIQGLAEILKSGEVTAPFIKNKELKSQWDRVVRLHFRPRSPELFRSEGFIPSQKNPEQHTPMPVYLLFDLEALVLHPHSRFSDGDPSKGYNTYSTPTAFAELPFEMIYHDSWTRGHEREEIMRYREAQVLIPERLSLEALQLIWVRSSAEYETLHHLLGTDLWKKWREKITPRADFTLFNHKRPYVQEASLTASHAILRFNPCHTNTKNDTYMAQVHVAYANGETHELTYEAFIPQELFNIAIPNNGAYELSLLLDGELAYLGKYTQDLLVL
jgi:hypothetical protein